MVLMRTKFAQNAPSCIGVDFPRYEFLSPWIPPISSVYRLRPKNYFKNMSLTGSTSMKKGLSQPSEHTPSRQLMSENGLGGVKSEIDLSSLDEKEQMERAVAERLLSLKEETPSFCKSPNKTPKLSGMMI